MPARDALGAQPARDLVGALRTAPRSCSDSSVPSGLDDPQRGLVGVLRGEHGVEPVDREVEVLGTRPAELGVGGRIVRPMGEKKIPSGAELICGTTHRHTVTQPS